MSLFWQLGVLALFVYYFFVFTPSNPAGDRGLLQKKSSTTTQAPAQVMQNIVLTEYLEDKEGQKEWVLDAKKALSDSFEQNWDVQESQVKFYKNNVEVVRIFAEHGKIDSKTRNLLLESNVRGETESGYVFKTNKLNYASDTESFISDSEIYFESPGLRTQLRGQAMHGMIPEGRIEITGPVECKQHIEGYKNASIRSQNAEISLSKRHMTFKKNLFIQMDDISITGQNAEFVYSKVKGELESLKITGKVFVTSGDRSASAERLEIRLKEDLFLFQGSPRFVSGKNVLVGNEIVLYDKGKRVQILKGQVQSEAPPKMSEE